VSAAADALDRAVAVIRADPSTAIQAAAAFADWLEAEARRERYTLAEFGYRTISDEARTAAAALVKLAEPGTREVVLEEVAALAERCVTCSQPHQPWQVPYSGDPPVHSWADPSDGHPYRRAQHPDVADWVRSLKEAT
jgi:hypothetical protein